MISPLFLINLFVVMQKIRWLGETKSVKQKTGCLPTCSSAFRKVVASLEKEIQDLKEHVKTQQEQIQSHIRISAFQRRQLLTIMQTMQERSDKIINFDNISVLKQKMSSIFEESSKGHNNLLKQQYDKSLQFFDRKVFEIEQEFQKQVQKIKDSVIADPMNIKNDLVNLYNQTLVVESNNINLYSENKKLKLDLQIMKDEKRLLIEQIIMLKKQISKISKKLTLTVADKQIKQFSPKNNELYNHYKDKILFNSSKKELEDKLSVSEPGKHLKYQTIDNGKILKNNEQYLKRNDLSFNSTVGGVTDRFSRSLRKNVNQSSSKKTSLRNSHNTIIPMEGNNLQKNKVQTKRSLSFNLTDQRKQQHSKSNLNKKYDIKDSMESLEELMKRQILYKRTIRHLEQTLKRQKARTVSLKNSYAKLHQNHKQISDILKEINIQNFGTENKINEFVFEPSFVDLLRKLESKIKQKQNLSCFLDDLIIQQ